jgi:hypothetical protein
MIGNANTPHAQPAPVRAELVLRQAQDDRKYKHSAHKPHPVRAELVLRQAQDDRKCKHSAHKPHPVRAELVEALPPKVQHFDKLSPFDRLRMLGHFDKLSPFDRLRMLGHFDKLSANGFLFVSGIYKTASSASSRVSS